MLFTFVVATLFLAGSAYAQTEPSLSDVTQAFEQAKIVPDVLPSFDPMAILEVVFTDPSTQQTLNVTPGIDLTMEQTLNEPQFFLTANATIPSSISYVVTIVDPDAPTPQNTSISQFRHLLGADFHVDGSGMLVNTSAALTDFVNPTPPAGSDPHRYVALVFLQPDSFDSVAPSLVNASTMRNNFNLTTFGQAVGLGSPIAGTFFLTGPSNSSTTASGSASQASVTSPSSASVVPSTSPSAATSSAKVSSDILRGRGAWSLILCGFIFFVLM